MFVLGLSLCDNHVGLVNIANRASGHCQYTVAEIQRGFERDQTYSRGLWVTNPLIDVQANALRQSDEVVARALQDLNSEWEDIKSIRRRRRKNGECPLEVYWKK